MEACAYGGRLDEPYDHPLLSESAVALLADETRSAEEILPDLLIRTTFDGTEDGPVAITHSVEWIEREEEPDRDSAVLAALESMASDDDAAGPRVGASVLNYADRAASGFVEEVELWVSLHRLSWNPIVSVEQELYLAMLEGRLDTRRDALAARHDAIELKAEAGAAALEPVLADLEEAGAEVVSANDLTGSARVRLDSDRLASVFALHDLARIDLVEPDETAAGYPSGSEVLGTAIDGVERENLLQSTQFYEAGYFGESDGYIGLTEGTSPDAGDEVRREHLGLDDASGNDRFENCAEIVGSACGTNPDPDPGNLHATRVASVLLGDITLGQDTGVPVAGRRKRSGVARRAAGLGTQSHYPSDVATVMTAASRDIHLVNYSGGSTGLDCTGATTRSQVYNSMFEDGLATFAAAGNETHSGSGCTVRDPGFALGVFTVGAYQVDSSDDEVIYSLQSRGGGELCTGGSCVDDGRTLIDIQGPTQHAYAYSEDSSDTDQYLHDLCCTSGATPAVAGSAALFRDWYLDVAGTLIDAPGVLYVALLLMGDRIDGSGAYLDSGLDELTGAGKLRLRRWDNLDLPARADEGVLCVGDGTSAYVQLDDDPLDSDVDMIKAAIWWYDHRHDSGSVAHDNVHLTLQSYNTSTSTWESVVSTTTDDNKQRVFTDSVAARKYRLKITGSDVSSNYEGCGIGSTRVYFAYLFEDQDRDTGTDLDDQIRPEE